MAVFGVMGPKSRELLSGLTDADLSDAAFPFASSRLISLGYATVRATRITYVGELGWELYVPSEFAVGVYEDLMSAGRRLGVARGGYYAIESMRLEKGYRAFGRELTPGDNPVEAGLLFACKLAGDVDFLGRAAVQRARDEGPRRRLASFVVDSPEPMLWGGELILRDGAVAGQVSSAAWGATVGSCVGLGYLRDTGGAVVTPDWVRAGSYAVNVGGEVYPITLSLKGIYDPRNERIR
jgi:4-methylaminobutanoate oxidase (formaldehyde-forming)